MARGVMCLFNPNFSGRFHEPEAEREQRGRQKGGGGFSGLWKNRRGWPVEYVSENVRRLFGYSAKEFMREEIAYSKTIHPGDVKRVAAEVKKYSAQEKRTRFTQEYRIVTKEGKIKWVDDRTVIRRDEKGNITHYEGLLLDITARKLAERELKGKSAQLKCLYELSKKITTFVSQEGLLMWIAEQSAKLLQADSCHTRIRAGNYLIRGGSTRLGKKLMKKDVLKVGESLSGIIAQDKKPLVVHNMRSDKRLIRKHDEAAQKLGMTSLLGVPMMIGNRVVGVICITTKKPRVFTGNDVELLTSFADMAAVAIDKTRLLEDLQETKRELEVFGEELEAKVEERTRELMELHNQLLHSERLAVSGRLAASIAHEINNPLQAINSFISAVIHESDKESKHVEYLELAQEGIFQIADIVKQLLAFSRPDKITREFQDINPIVEKTLLMVKKELAKGRIKVMIELAPDLPEVKVSAQQINQVLVNLILNAKDAMPEGGELRIKTGRDNLGIYIQICDTGTGMSEEVMERMYEPFFTTKKEKGSGLGLSVSFGIIKAHGGDMIAESKEGKGTSFTISLPANGLSEESGTE
jgi:PAS domain S-box-containing protein